MWGLVFHSHLLKVEEAQFQSMLYKFSMMRTVLQESNRRVWMGIADNKLLISAYFSILREVGDTASWWHLYGNQHPSKGVALKWIPLLGDILMMDNLWQRTRIIVNGCLMCLVDAKFTDHLLVRGNMDQFLWTFVILWFRCSWVLPNSLFHLFEAWCGVP